MNSNRPHLLRSVAGIVLASCVFLVASCASLIYDNTLLSIPGIRAIPFPVNMRPIFTPKWSPLGDMIGVVGYSDNINEAYIFDLIENETQVISINEMKFIANYISWSPDGKWLAVTGEPEGRWREGGVWITDVNGADMWFLTYGYASDWSPSGDQLVVVEPHKGSASIKLVNLKTKEEEIIYLMEGETGFVQVEVDWSPSGDLIALTMPSETSNENRFDQLYLLRLDGFSVTILPGNEEWNVGSPSWFPGGEWLAFLSWGSGEGVISVAPVTGDCVMSLLPQGVTALELDISPDGKSVVFNHAGRVYIADLEEAVGLHVLPGALSCP